MSKLLYNVLQISGGKCPPLVARLIPTLEVQTVAFYINFLRWRYKQLFSKSTPTLVVHPYAGGTTLRWCYRRCWPLLLNISIRKYMRIVHNYNLRYHIEKNCALLVKIFHQLIVVGLGNCSHDIQDKVCLPVSIFPHEATALLELFYL